MPAAIDDFALYQNPGLSTPFNHAAAVTPSDTADLTHVARAIYVGGAGDVAVDTIGGETAVVFPSIPAGSILSGRIKRVRSTGTTASGIVAVW